MSAIVTVITPTYNRANLLKRTYDSLIIQSDKRFEWLIIDDGSTDNTKNLIESYIIENIIPIKYIYKENGGKHTAINVGLEIIKTPLVIILDSDDYLTNNALEIIIKYYFKYNNHDNICGFVFLKIYPNGDLNGKLFPINEQICSFIDRRVNGKIHGDKCEVLYTKYFKKHKFPEYKGEKFISESTVWISMGLKYEMVFINEKIYVAEYLENGLTKQGRKLRISSPNGSMENARIRMNNKSNFIRRFKGGILYSCYGLFAQKKLSVIIRNNEYKLLTIISLPFGYVLYRYWNSKHINKS